MKRITTWMVLVVVVFAVIFSNPARAYADCETSDVCDEGINVHFFKVPLTFVFSKNVNEKTMPWKGTYKGMHSESATHHEKGSSIEIKGLLRNHNNHIWMYTVNGGYVCLDNLLFDFNANAVQYFAMMQIGTDEKVEFLKLFLPEGDADLKRMLDPSSKGIQYKVLFSSTCSIMTGESLGNMMFGFLGKEAGFDDSVLLEAGGILNIVELDKNLVHHPEWCLDSYCDSPEDIASVQAGINYYRNF